MIGKDVFQEVDITGATSGCKHNYLVKDAKEIPKIMREAFYIASTGRPGHCSYRYTYRYAGEKYYI